jgi:uncharacterized protein
MPRPHSCRRVGPGPAVSLFKPAGVPRLELEEIVVSLDEYEAIRLADGEGLYHAQAASRMGVSRATFGRILEAARGKVARALAGGCALRIEGGPVHPVRGYRVRCQSCTHEWSVEAKQARPIACPRCDSAEVTCCGCCRARGRRALAGPQQHTARSQE